MGSEELGHENRATYNLILAAFTVLALLCGYLMHQDSPLPPSVRLDSFFANYTATPHNTYPQKIGFNATFFVKFTVINEETEMPTVVDYVDVWVNTRAKEFLRIMLGQKLMLEPLELGPGETKELEVEVPHFRPIQITAWPRMVVTVFVRAKFPTISDVFGRTREAYKTRNCIGLKGTLQEATKTVVVENKPFPQWCTAPY